MSRRRAPMQRRIVLKENVRVTYDDKGRLDEVVTDGGCHLEHMGGKDWFLACYRDDGSTFAIWFNGKISMTEEQAP